jgi:cell division initiation protein
MSLTPVEIRHVKLDRRPLGYERRAVEHLLEEIAASFEDVWRERADLRDEIERLESELHRQREIEEALRNTLLSAERMARARAREVAGAGDAEQERVRAEIRRLRALELDVRAEYRAFLASALERLEGGPPGGLAEPEQGRHQAA